MSGLLKLLAKGIAAVVAIVFVTAGGPALGQALGIGQVVGLLAAAAVVLVVIVGARFVSLSRTDHATDRRVNLVTRWLVLMCGLAMAGLLASSDRDRTPWLVVTAVIGGALLVRYRRQESYLGSLTIGDRQDADLIFGTWSRWLHRALAFVWLWSCFRIGTTSPPSSITFSFGLLMPLPGIACLAMRRSPLGLLASPVIFVVAVVAAGLGFSQVPCFWCLVNAMHCLVLAMQRPHDRRYNSTWDFRRVERSVPW